jgi:hypothetical protein
VPIRQQDVAIIRGRYLDVELPRPKTIFESQYAAG